MNVTQKLNIAFCPSVAVYRQIHLIWCTLHVHCSASLGDLVIVSLQLSASWPWLPWGIVVMLLVGMVAGVRCRWRPRRVNDAPLSAHASPGEAPFICLRSPFCCHRVVNFIRPGIKAQG